MPNPVTDTVTFWPLFRLREGVTKTLGSGAVAAGVRPDFDVVVVSAGLIVVVVIGDVVSAGREVVVVSEELAEVEVQFDNAIGSIAITITAGNFPGELIFRYLFT